MYICMLLWFVCFVSATAAAAAAAAVADAAVQRHRHTPRDRDTYRDMNTETQTCDAGPPKGFYGGYIGSLMNI